MKNASFANSAVFNKTTEIEKSFKENGEAVTVAVVNNRKTKILVVAKIYDDENITIKGQPLTQYEKTVFNGVCSVYEECERTNNYVFTPEIVYRAMNGITNSEHISVKSLLPVIEAIEHLSSRKVEIDATEQIKKLYKNVKKCKFKNYFLPIKEVEAQFTNSNNVVNAYQFLDIPPIYDYSRLINQVISVPIEILAITNQSGSNSKNKTVIRAYLIKRIESLKSPKSKLANSKIKYSTIFGHADINETNLTQTERNRLRKLITGMLNDWKDGGFIEDYREYKTGRRYEGIEIDVKRQTISKKKKY